MEFKKLYNKSIIPGQYSWLSVEEFLFQETADDRVIIQDFIKSPYFNFYQTDLNEIKVNKKEFEAGMLIRESNILTDEDKESMNFHGRYDIKKLSINNFTKVDFFNFKCFFFKAFNKEDIEKEKCFHFLEQLDTLDKNRYLYYILDLVNESMEHDCRIFDFSYTSIIIDNEFQFLILVDFGYD